MVDLSVKRFREILGEELDELCHENGWQDSTPARKGQAFEIWCANLVAEDEARFDTDPVDARLGGPNDLGVDLVFSNANSGEFLVCQCKYAGSGKLRNEKVNEFLSLHARLTTPGHLEAHGLAGLADALPPDALRKAPHKVTYRLITNARVMDKDKALTVAGGQDEVVDVPVYEIWDRDDLKRVYIQNVSRGDEAPDEVVIDLPDGKYFEITEPKPGVIAVLTTNALRNLWDQFRNSLYAENIRGGLNSKLNREMQQTLAQRPSEFFYFNNGISAICEDFDVEPRGGKQRKLKAKKFQVINGAQTLNAIGVKPMTSDGRVLFRLTKTDDVSIESDVVKEIIRYNNKQNIVKDSDFRSNDLIQKWLEKELARANWRWPAMPRRRYVRKRQYRLPPGLGKVLKLEDLGKIRYAWLHEPMRVVDATGTLFQDSDAGGKYTQAFGIDGELVNVWPKSELESALLAVWFHDALAERIKSVSERRRAKGEEGHEWLTLYRWHFLSLAGMWFRDGQHDAGTMLRSPDLCNEEFEKYFDQAYDVLSTAERHRVQDERTGRRPLTMRNWRRSAAEWEQVKENFRVALQHEKLKADLQSGV